MWDSIVQFIGYLFFWFGMLIGIFVIPIGVPGTFLIAGLAMFQGLVTGFGTLSVQFVVILFAIAISGELIEFFFGALAAKRFGGSKYAMWGAILGGFIGAVWATGILPIVGTLLGAFAGAFTGATVLEFLHSKQLEHALRVGWGAFLGTIGGKVTKITIGIAMVVMTIYQFVS